MALLLVGAAAPALAQTFPTIRTGQSVSGTLAESDPAPTERGRFKVYRFEAAAGRPYLITLSSADFDAYLRVARNTGGITDVLKEDDDGAGGSNARIRFKATEAGTYLIVAQALEGEGKGAFELRLADAPATTTDAPRALRMGETVRGTLAETDAVLEDDNTFYDTYLIQGRPGQRIQVTMEASSFDTFLNLGRMTGSEFVSKANDDDGAGEGTNSRLRATLDEEGEYVLRANSVGAGTGPYTLTLTERPEPRPVQAQAVRAGTDAAGTLAEGDAENEDGTLYDVWSYRGAMGEALTLSLSSDVFDTKLTIGQMANGRFQELASNDDGPDGTNSRIEVTLPVAGEYLIRTAALGAGEMGAYQLRVTTARGR